MLVDSRFRAKVADFGLAVKYKGCTGTPYWMAPELLRSERPTTASDVSAEEGGRGGWGGGGCDCRCC